MNLRVRPRVNNTSFFAFEVSRFVGGTFFNKIMIIVSSLTTLAHFKVLYALACSLVKVAAPRFISDYNEKPSAYLKSTLT